MESVKFSLATVEFLLGHKQYPGSSLVFKATGDEHFQPSIAVVSPQTEKLLSIVETRENIDEDVLRKTAAECSEFRSRLNRDLPIFLLVSSVADKYEVRLFKLSADGNWQKISKADFPGYSELCASNFEPATQVTKGATAKTSVEVPKFNKRKKYSIFISSTYSDLIEERQEVLNAVLRLGHFPVGMELFPAKNNDQLSLIKTSIKESDYYVVICAGRYGSMANSDDSFTELEYDYAVSRNLRILRFLREPIANLPADKRDSVSESIAKLDAFRAKLSHFSCSYWSDAHDLGKKVTASLANIFSEDPAIGWVRGDAPLSKPKQKRLSGSRSFQEQVREQNVEPDEEKLLVEISKSNERAIPGEIAGRMQMSITKTNHLISELKSKGFLEENIDYDDNYFVHLNAKSRSHLVKQGLV